MDECLLQRGRLIKEILREDEVEQAEHDIVLEVCIATGKIDNAESASRDSAEMLSFLRKLVSNGKVEFLEHVLQTLTDLEKKQSREEHSEDKCSNCPVHPGSHDEMCIRCKQLHHYGLRLATTVGRRHSERENAQRPAGSIEVMDECVFAHKGPIAPPNVRALLNTVSITMVFWTMRTNLLCTAVMLGYEDVVKCLLKWGALPSQSPANDLPPLCPWSVNPIRIAVSLKQPAIIRSLLESGASPYHAVWSKKGYLIPFSHGGWAGDPAACEALCQNPNYPPLIWQVVRVMQLGNDESASCMMRYLRWRADFMEFTLAPTLMATPSSSTVLDTPCYSNAEKICKMLCCAKVLANLCMDLESETSRLEAIIRHILQVGTNPAGLPVSKADALYRKWWKLKENNAVSRYVLRSFIRQGAWNQLLMEAQTEPVDSRLAPCVTQQMRVHIPMTLQAYEPRYWHQATDRNDVAPAMSRVLRKRSADDPIVHLLIRYGGIPGISESHEIPLVGGNLHDGPTCQCAVELSAAQRATNVCDLFMPARQAKSLSYQCRAAILEMCQGFERLESIQSLGLPPRLVNYLLYK
eukprot:scpid44974/ scgid34413/ 